MKTKKLFLIFQLLISIKTLNPIIISYNSFLVNDKFVLLLGDSFGSQLIQLLPNNDVTNQLRQKNIELNKIQFEHIVNNFKILSLQSYKGVTIFQGHKKANYEQDLKETAAALKITDEDLLQGRDLTSQIQYFFNKNDFTLNNLKGIASDEVRLDLKNFKELNSHYLKLDYVKYNKLKTNELTLVDTPIKSIDEIFFKAPDVFANQIEMLRNNLPNESSQGYVSTLLENLRANIKSAQDAIIKISTSLSLPITLDFDKFIYSILIKSNNVLEMKFIIYKLNQVTMDLIHLIGDLNAIKFLFEQLCVSENRYIFVIGGHNHILFLKGFLATLPTSVLTQSNGSSKIKREAVNNEEDIIKTLNEEQEISGKLDIKEVIENFVTNVNGTTSSSSSSDINAVLKKCNVCGKSVETIKRCSRCKKIFYCSQECQKIDWPVHKTYCKKS